MFTSPLATTHSMDDDDGQAQAVMEALAGVRRCPVCQQLLHQLGDAFKPYFVCVNLGCSVSYVTIDSNCRDWIRLRD